MRVSKREIVEFFMTRGDLDRAERADATLPDPVDLTDDAPALEALDLDPGLLATQIDNLEA